MTDARYGDRKPHSRQSAPPLRNNKVPQRAECAKNTQPRTGLLEGHLQARDMGTPQCGVSPILVSLFLHHAFDLRVTHHLPGVRFALCW